MTQHPETEENPTQKLAPLRERAVQGPRAPDGDRDRVHHHDRDRRQAHQELKPQPTYRSAKRLSGGASIDEENADVTRGRDPRVENSVDLAGGFSFAARAREGCFAREEDLDRAGRPSETGWRLCTVRLNGGGASRKASALCERRNRISVHPLRSCAYG
ncbi:uncharacterized protein A4U43_C08F31900 [Asparagus officinalis]|nr:uncharacterized protein A4U43_C08F31900 [Asparagus officinalis]